MLMVLAWLFMIGSFFFMAIAIFSTMYIYYNKLTNDGINNLLEVLIRKLILAMIIFMVCFCYIFIN
jgi:hypothetical protein